MCQFECVPIWCPQTLCGLRMKFAQVTWHELIDGRDWGMGKMRQGGQLHILQLLMCMNSVCLRGWVGWRVGGRQWWRWMGVDGCGQLQNTIFWSGILVRAKTISGWENTACECKPKVKVATPCWLHCLFHEWCQKMEQLLKVGNVSLAHLVCMDEVALRHKK
jgi:hypothetical protein